MKGRYPGESMRSPLLAIVEGVPVGERELVLAAQSGDRAARDALMEMFMPLVASVARRYRGTPTLNRDEQIVQSAMPGMVRELNLELNSSPVLR